MRSLIGFIFIAILLSSCKESEQNKIARLINEWNGKVIRFPDSICLTSYGNDTVITKFEREQSAYTILNYVDTMGCVSCRLQLPRWNEMMEELDSICQDKIKVNCLMVFYPKEKEKLVKLLRKSQFNDFVYIDEKDTLNEMNNFLNEEHFCTFLLDKDDKIVAIGNPVLRPKVKELYFDIISGKTVLASTDKQTETVASLSEDQIDLGNFSWNKERKAEFVISNTGKTPLVINDIITSCGCTTVDYSKEPIRPNESTTLNIKYKAEHPEHFNKTITVYCNAENSPLKLRITGNAE